MRTKSKLKRLTTCRRYPMEVGDRFARFFISLIRQQCFTDDIDNLASIWGKSGITDERVVNLA